MFNRINEGFNNKYQSIQEGATPDSELLRRVLTTTANSMLRMGSDNLKAYEVAFQQDIEDFFPDCLWWEVTNCNIFMELFNSRDPLAVVDCIIDNLTDEFKNGGLNDTLKDAVKQKQDEDELKSTAADNLVKELDNTIHESNKLTEAPAFTLNADDMNNPSEVNFKKIMKRNAEEEAKAQAEKERQAKIAAAKEKYKDAIDGIESMSAEDAIRSLHNKLVPAQGVADTVAGELVRAMMRILYRDWNDGDKFFMGYGLETCGGSAQYLYDMGIKTSMDTILDDTHRYADDDDKYTDMLNEVAKEVVDHILNNPELLGEPNETDSRDYHCEYIEECQPKYDYDFTLPYEVQKYLEAGHIITNEIEDILDSNLYGNGIRFSSIECYSDCVYIYDLDYDAYEEVQRWKMYDESYWSYELEEWESQYGDPDEEEDEDDIDESKSLKESPVYDLVPSYDNRKSFYNKARVDINGDEQTLYSYNTPVAKIVGGKVELLPKWDWSQTTLRHVKEFLKQNGFEATSLAQMKKDYI